MTSTIGTPAWIPSLKLAPGAAGLSHVILTGRATGVPHRTVKPVASDASPPKMGWLRRGSARWKITSDLAGSPERTFTGMRQGLP